MEVEAKEVEAFVMQIYHTRLGGVQRQLQPSEKLRDQIPCLLSLRCTSADDHEVIAVPMELTDTSMVILPPSIQRVQIDVGQQGADDSSYTVGNFEFERVIPYRRTWNAR